MTKTAELADVVFPASNAAFESEGTVTNSERRVQRVRKALEPPGEARDDIWIIAQLADRLGARLGRGHAARGLGGAADALADARGDVLAAAGGAGRAAVAVPRRGPPGHAVPARAGCGRTTPPSRAPKAPFSRGDRRPAGGRAGRGVPAPAHDRAAGWTRTTPACRRAATPRRCGAARRSTCRRRTRRRLGVAEGECVMVSSRRGALEVAGAHRPRAAARASCS